MSQPKFCEQCGAPLGPGARFCNQCGQPVVAAPASQPRPVEPVATVPQPAAAPTAAASGEPVYGVIPGAQRRKGLLGFQTFSIVVTPQRLVFAETTSQMQKDAVREAADEAKRQGKGLLGRVAAQMGWLNRVAQRYYQMPVEMALRENKDNFFILNSHVRKVTVRETQDDETLQSSCYLAIEASSGKYSFELKAGQPKEARELLRQTLGAAVR